MSARRVNRGIRSEIGCDRIFTKVVLVLNVTYLILNLDSAKAKGGSHERPKFKDNFRTQDCISRYAGGASQTGGRRMSGVRQARGAS
jgi:hypothetical protein